MAFSPSSPLPVLALVDREEKISQNIRNSPPAQPSTAPALDKISSKTEVWGGEERRGQDRIWGKLLQFKSNKTDWERIYLVLIKMLRICLDEAGSKQYWFKTMLQKYPVYCLEIRMEFPFQFTSIDLHLYRRATKCSILAIQLVNWTIKFWYLLFFFTMEEPMTKKSEQYNEDNDTHHSTLSLSCNPYCWFSGLQLQVIKRFCSYWLTKSCLTFFSLFC